MKCNEMPTVGRPHELVRFTCDPDAGLIEESRNSVCAAGPSLTF
jgi:hypothetical protein